MIWKNIAALWLLIPFILLFLFIRKRKKPSLQWSHLKSHFNQGFSLRVFLSPIPFLLQIISIVLIIVALARPQSINSSSSKSLEGIDIMMVLDISFSMMVPDMSPGTRLSASQDVLQKFIDGLHSDRVGLVLFSGESYTKVPLTLDYELLKEEIAGIETTSNIQQGTAIGVSLANAVARLRHSDAKSRVIVLLTDGENNAGNISPQTAVSLAKNYDIKIYSIGIGAQSRARIPIKTRDYFGRERVVYQVIDSQVNQELLSDISKQTNGKFYLAKNLTNLKNIFSEIGSLEKSKITSFNTFYKEDFQKYLEMAFWLFLTSLILSITFFGRVI